MSLNGPLDPSVVVSQTQVQTPAAYQRPIMVANSLPMQRVMSRLVKVSKIDFFPLFLTGETGVGKQEAASFVHEMSRHRQDSGNRGGRAFIDVNCGGLAPTLLETELFGHEAGAFTDAKHKKLGQLELASGGSLFLDEVGHASLEVQKRLLKFLDGHGFYRVGGTQVVHVKTRVIAATNSDLSLAVRKGSFQRDLFYRLKTYHIHIPPLRERVEEIESLTVTCIMRFNREYGTNISTEVDMLVLNELSKRRWPGNIRELFNAVKTAIINHGVSGKLGISDFDFDGEEFLEVNDRQDGSDIDKIGDNLTLKELERLHVIALLKRYYYNPTKVSEVLGIGPRALHYKIKQHNIKIQELRATTPGEN